MYMINSKNKKYIVMIMVIYVLSSTLFETFETTPNVVVLHINSGWISWWNTNNSTYM